MPIDAISYLLPVLLVLWNAFLLAIPAFVLAYIGAWLVKWVEGWGRPGRAGKKKKSTVKYAFIATYILVFIVLLALYAAPFASAWQSIDNSGTPSELQPTSEEWSIFLGIQAVKLVLISLVFSLILLPFEFVGLWVYEHFALKRKTNALVSAFIACFAMCLIALITILALPWVFPGLVYLVYFA